MLYRSPPLRLYNINAKLKPRDGREPSLNFVIKRLPEYCNLTVRQPPLSLGCLCVCLRSYSRRSSSEWCRGLLIPLGGGPQGPEGRWDGQACLDEQCLKKADGTILATKRLSTLYLPDIMSSRNIIEHDDCHTVKEYREHHPAGYFCRLL